MHYMWADIFKHDTTPLTIHLDGSSVPNVENTLKEKIIWSCTWLHTKLVM